MHILLGIYGLGILENNMEFEMNMDKQNINQEVRPSPVHLAAVFSLNWFCDWKSNVDLYCKVRDVVSSKSERLSGKGSDVFKVLDDFFVKMERGEIISEAEFVASVFILRDIVTEDFSYFK